MKEQVLITALKITKAGQVKTFQVRIPKNAVRIIGIEIGGRLIKSPRRDGTRSEAIDVASGNGTIAGEFNPKLNMHAEAIKSLMPFKRNVLFGELKLQSCEEANIFYAAHVMSDENIGMGDFSKKGNWDAHVFTHQQKTEEDIVIVNGDSTIIQGIYKDRIGELNKMDYQYIMNVYVWVEVEAERKGGNT